MAPSENSPRLQCEAPDQHPEAVVHKTSSIPITQGSFSRRLVARHSLYTAEPRGGCQCTMRWVDRFRQAAKHPTTKEQVVKFRITDQRILIMAEEVVLFNLIIMTPLAKQ